LLTSPEQHQWVAHRLEEWSARGESSRLGDAPLEKEMMSLARLTKVVADFERSEAMPQSASLQRRQQAYAEAAAAHRDIVQQMQRLATACEFPVSVDITGEQAWSVLGRESAAICWCIQAGPPGVSGRVDALVSFNPQGKVVQVSPWDTEWDELEFSGDEALVVAASRGVWSWDKLTDESTQRCILDTLREISFAPQGARFSVLYSIAIGEPTRMLPKGAFPDHLPTRLCR
jgi:hypothetical protein